VIYTRKQLDEAIDAAEKDGACPCHRSDTGGSYRGYPLRLKDGYHNSWQLWIDTGKHYSVALDLAPWLVAGLRQESQSSSDRNAAIQQSYAHTREQAREIFAASTKAQGLPTDWTRTANGHLECHPQGKIKTAEVYLDGDCLEIRDGALGIRLPVAVVEALLADRIVRVAPKPSVTDIMINQLVDQINEKDWKLKAERLALNQAKADLARCAAGPWKEWPDTSGPCPVPGKRYLLRQRYLTETPMGTIREILGFSVIHPHWLDENGETITGVTHFAELGEAS